MCINRYKANRVCLELLRQLRVLFIEGSRTGAANDSDEENDDDDTPCFDEPYITTRQRVLAAGKPELVRLIDQECRAFAQHVRFSFNSRFAPYRTVMRALEAVDPSARSKLVGKTLDALQLLSSCAGLSFKAVRGDIIRMRAWYKCVGCWCELFCTTPTHCELQIVMKSPLIMIYCCSCVCACVPACARPFVRLPVGPRVCDNRFEGR